MKEIRHNNAFCQLSRVLIEGVGSTKTTIGRHGHTEEGHNYVVVSSPFYLLIVIFVF
jgi:hypothetical protein